jgi:hypothetical protein
VFDGGGLRKEAEIERKKKKILFPFSLLLGYQLV